MGDGGGDIIIKGGSVHVSFDSNVYQKDPDDPGTHKHPGRKITRVRVEDENGKDLYDSGHNDGGLKWKVTVSTK
jgi:hypothetical protein